MKKLIAVCLLGLSAASVWAQGQVNFLNGGATFATTANRYVYFGAVGPGAVLPSFPNFLGSADPNRVTGTTWVAGLWYLAGANRGQEIGTAAQAGRTFAFRAATTLEQNRGTWVVPIGANSLFDLAGVNFGSGATLQVRVWDGAKYTSFDAALAANEYGRSDAFNYNAPVQGELNPNAYLMDNLRAFAVIPEPSTIVLGLLGAASLLALRRRK
jgi:hypothetical protein